MWLLKHKDGRLIYLQAHKAIVFGRKQADVTLENDPSISRSHASILVTLKEQVSLSEALSTCIIKDIGSKYGSTINRKGKTLNVTKEGCELEASDEIRFGKQDHIFTVEYMRILTVTSRLNKDHTDQLLEILNKVGGIIAPNFYDACTHLTATEATTTDKIISSLIAGLPIVNINYWKSFLKAVEANASLPDPNKYTLTLTDANIKPNSISLLPNPARKTIFRGNTFVCFSDDQMKMYKKMIVGSGGKLVKCTLNESVDLDSIISDDKIFMQFGTTLETTKIGDDFSEMYTNLQDKLQNKGLRMISETEMPLAVLYVSTKQYCNPSYDFKHLMKRKQLKQDSSKVIAPDTQDVYPSSSTPRNKGCIPETHDFIAETQATDRFNESKNMEEDSENKVAPTETPTENTTPQKLEIIKKRPRDDCFEDDEMERVTKKFNIEKRTKELTIDPSSDIVINRNLREQIVLNAQDDLPKKTDEPNKKPSSNKPSNVFLKPMECKPSTSKVTSKPMDSKPSTSKAADTGTKKRQRETSHDVEEISDWKSAKKLCSDESSRKKSNTSISSDNTSFVSSQSQTDKPNKLKINKWGLKNSEKASNLEFHDLMSNVSKVEPNFEQNETEHQTDESHIAETEPVIKKKRDVFNEFFEPPEPKKKKKILEKSVNTDFEPKEPKKKKKILEESVNTDWSSNIYVCKKEVLSDEDVENSSQMSSIKASSSFLRANIKLEPGTIKSEFKAFKKVYDPVPKKRIALADMSVWRPNSL